MGEIERPLKKNEEKKDKDIKEEDEERLKEDKDSNSNISDDSKQKIIVGTFQEAPKFLQDNEFIKRGYVINCTSFKKALKCLFICHNETMNTWSHLLGAVVFIFFIFYTFFIFRDFDIQLNIIKEDHLPSVEQKAISLYELSPGSMYNFYESTKIIQNNFNYYNQTIFYNKTIKNIFSLYKDVYEYVAKKVPLYLDYIKSFLESLSILKKSSLDLINLDESKNKQLESYLNSDIKIALKDRPKIELTRFPLLIIIVCAFLCLSFSATYHAFKIISPIIHNITHRFDHGGISLLITGSCFPPYYYCFYYETKLKYFYLIEISVLGIGIFLYSILSSDFSKPYKRAFRGILFLIFGISTGIPVLHMSFFSKNINGYAPGIKLINWYLGGASYIIGALLYILRFPEKKFQGKFDYFGSSHQLFHIFVFAGATFHYFGSLDIYIYRFKNMDI